MALTDKLTAIADAIRAKDGSADKLTLAQMPEKIAAIQTGTDTGDATGWSSSSRPGTLKSRARAGYICSSIRSCRTAGICPRLG